MNKASKDKAVQLIKRAVKNGWKREVSLISPKSPIVYLDAQASKGALFTSGLIIISFRNWGKKRSISITSRMDFQQKAIGGLYNAEYAIDYMAKAKARCQ
jgi:hypothetical protein